MIGLGKGRLQFWAHTVQGAKAGGGGGGGVSAQT